MKPSLTAFRPFRTWPAVKRNAIIGSVTAVVGSSIYYVSAYAIDPGSGRSLATSLDAAIPFLPASAYAYVAIYTAMFFPAFVIRSYEIFRRTIAAYIAVVLTSAILFVAFPVTATDFRADLGSLDESIFHHWGMHLIYFLDPPTNLFPSLHLSVATVAALSTRYAHRGYALIPGFLAASIAISIFTTKQHFLADGLAGFVLGATMVTLCFRGYDPASESPQERIFDRGALKAFVAFHAAIYLTAYLLFAADWRPWLAVGG